MHANSFPDVGIQLDNSSLIRTVRNLDNLARFSSWQFDTHPVSEAMSRMKDKQNFQLVSMRPAIPQDELGSAAGGRIGLISVTGRYTCTKAHPPQAWK